MNIFYLDSNPVKCAQMHCDKHCIKMILESAQLLCSVHWLTGNQAPYKLTHKNHPCAIWVRTSLSNYKWLCLMAISLCREYNIRYGKTHKTTDVILWCMKNLPNIPDIGMTQISLAMPEQYKTKCPVQSYRNYYISEKLKIATWKSGNVPKWIVPHIRK